MVPAVTRHCAEPADPTMVTVGISRPTMERRAVGRHADAAADGFAAVPTVARRGGSRMTAGLVSAVLVALLAALAIPAALPGVLPGVRGVLPWFPARAACASTTVEVVAPPSVQALVNTVIAPVQGHLLDDGTCLEVRVRAQEPAETVTSSDVLPPAQAPQVWISDSTLWSALLTRWKTQQVGSLGTSPVVLVSSASAVTRLGWASRPPSWIQAMDGTHPLATGALDADGRPRSGPACVPGWRATTGAHPGTWCR
jgi:hypothetical protein